MLLDEDVSVEVLSDRGDVSRMACLLIGKRCALRLAAWHESRGEGEVRQAVRELPWRSIVAVWDSDVVGEADGEGVDPAEMQDFFDMSDMVMLRLSRDAAGYDGEDSELVGAVLDLLDPIRDVYFGSIDGEGWLNAFFDIINAMVRLGIVRDDADLGGRVDQLFRLLCQKEWVAAESLVHDLEQGT